MEKRAKLNRTLGLPLLTLYGLGNILGAGIYVLVGKVAGFAGTSTTLAFLLAMFVAGITAFSYMELSGRYPVSASVSVYLHKAFGKKHFSVAIGLAMVAGGITSAAALSQGFAGYFSTFIDSPEFTASVGLLILIGALAIKGINESAKAAAIFTFIEIAGLALVIYFGRSAFSEVSVSDLASIDPAFGVGGLVAGAFLAFYAFIGFEDMANVAEEVKNPKKNMPLAILFALISSTILYVLVVVVATSIVTPEELAQSGAPLTLVFERSGANGSLVLSLIGMVAAFNGVIVQLIMGSRILYGLSSQGWLHSSLSRVSKRFKTPTNATLLVLSLMILGTILLPLVSLAQITSLLVLSIFASVNASLIVIKKREPDHEGYISVPAIVPYLGLVSCVGLIIYQLFFG
jgi:basic amino acid/polyamine antiporter, APA family